MNYFLIVFGLIVMFVPLIMQMLWSNSMYGFYLVFTFVPGLIILAIGLIRSHKDKNNKVFLKPKNKILGADINPGVLIVVLLFLVLVIPAIINWFN